ncbi:MAG: chemotaxis-specific protein-glutamate methyltransferase CheB [Desulfuromonadales bacterium]|nr:chemotaxis-specific protein-glutamate methyltransferase CheB [Desulfuromonadales bacterium]
MTGRQQAKIRVLIVDDSPSVRMMLEQIFSTDAAFEVAGQAGDGEEAVKAVEQLSPDVVTMDILMPRMNGLEATRMIMERHPLPIIIVSGNLDPEEVLTSFRAMEAGALTALPKPRGPSHPEHAADVTQLLQKVKLMAEVRVVRRWHDAGAKSHPQAFPHAPVAHTSPQVVAIGASTGGPPVINTILSGLQPDFPLPLLIVQHMAPGFIGGFAQWLNLTSRLPVRIASQGEGLLPGHVYIAPEGFHMEVAQAGRIALRRGAPENAQLPSVDALFRSVAGIFGRNAIGILLTGMGDDGARELKQMKNRGAVTIAQDRESSVIYGMPGEAEKIGAATYCFPPGRIVEYLTSIRGI